LAVEISKIFPGEVQDQEREQLIQTAIHEFFLRRERRLLGQIVRRSDGNNLAVNRLYYDSSESFCAGRNAVGDDSIGAESGIETSTRG
jgi:hypothetical protein